MVKCLIDLVNRLCHHALPITVNALKKILTNLTGVGITWVLTETGKERLQYHHYVLRQCRSLSAEMKSVWKISRQG